jgi:hypothetical protein
MEKTHKEDFAFEKRSCDALEIIVGIYLESF